MSPQEEETGRDLREAFDVLDSNKDGLISIKELVTVQVSLGLRRINGATCAGRPTVTKCRGIIRLVDSNNTMVQLRGVQAHDRCGQSLSSSSSARMEAGDVVRTSIRQSQSRTLPYGSTRGIDPLVLMEQPLVPSSHPHSRLFPVI
jgi:hypothetical protein